MEGAVFLRQLAALGNGLDQGDVGAAGHMDGLQRQKADGAAARDGHALAQLELDLVHEAGGDGNGLQQAAGLEAHVVGQLEDLGLVPYDGLAHAGVVGGVAVLAELLLPVAAVVAGAAEMQEVAGDPVAHLQALLRGLGAHLDDDAGELMPQAVGGIPAENVLHQMGVGAADGAVRDLDAHVLVPERLLRNVADLHAAPGLLIGVAQAADLHDSNGFHTFFLLFIWIYGFNMLMGTLYCFAHSFTRGFSDIVFFSGRGVLQ